MYFPRLNLKGIHTPSRPPAPKPKVEPIKLEKKKVVIRSQLRRILRLGRIQWKFSVIILLCLAVMVSMYVLQHKHNMLRQIKKVPCQNVNGMFICKSTYSTGTMMLSTTPLCKTYIYDIDGTPFVNIPSWNGRTVSTSAKKIMRIHDAKPTCQLSMHHMTKPHVSPPISGVVWVTTKKHTQFTMTIQDTVVLDQTPSDFIDSETNGEWVAYSFDPQIDQVEIQDVKITGDSSDIIHIYT